MANKVNPVWLVPASFGGAGNGTTGGVQLSSTNPTATNSALPTTAAGGRPVAVYVQALGNGYCRLQIGSGNNATVNDIAVTANNPVCLPVGAYTFISFLADAGTVKCNVTALEMP